MSDIVLTVGKKRYPLPNYRLDPSGADNLKVSILMRSTIGVSAREADRRIAELMMLQFKDGATER